jgi:hypothetical protein
MMPTLEIKRLGSYLVDAGLVTLSQIDVALNDQEFMDDMRIGEILVTRGWIKQQTLDFVIEKVVEPEQAIARRTTMEDAMVNRHQPQHRATVAVPIGQSARSDGAQTTIAHARSLDGSRVIEILKTQKSYTVSDRNCPTDPGQVNDRKPLSSVPADGDEMNWVG